jgi:hypothetical protein
MYQCSKSASGYGSVCFLGLTDPDSLVRGTRYGFEDLDPQHGSPESGPHWQCHAIGSWI